MITRLRFKNWRSLRDVTIDNLTPITVFIGANSSGKTNILDGLYFLRDAVSSSLPVAWNRRLYPDDYRSSGSDLSDPLELGFSFQAEGKKKELSYQYSEKGQSGTGQFSERLTDSDGKPFLTSDSNMIEAINNEGNPTRIEPSGDLGISAFGRLSTYPQIQQTFQFITQRWQMLNENFMPPMSVDSRSSYDPYTIINQCADNLPVMLEFMYRNHNDLYLHLQEDLRWLLSHIDKLEVNQINYQIRALIREKGRPDKEAPTISAGTARILAMLAAYYALDMRSPEMPGLVVIEEPDTALNPGLLSNFVGLLRNYIAGEHPRQFILTTHNPVFLNFFKPEEVRVVKRNEEGYTTVEAIPDHIREDWLDEYGLGEVWTTNSLGGLAE